MLSEIIKNDKREIPIITNNSKSKKLLLYVHGLDGSASFSKPLFKNLSEYKVVAMEQRGHDNSPMPASRSIKKHLADYMFLIEHYKKLGYKVWALGESMGAAYMTMLAYKTSDLIEAVFVQSIPNKLENIMVAPKWVQFKVQFMTTLSFLTNVNYSYTATVNYKLLSSSRVIHRLARIADKTKKRQVRETLATWAVTKRAWKRMKRKDPLTQIYYFQPDTDVIVNIKKARKAIGTNRKNLEYIEVKNSRHILMFEPGFKDVIKKIKQVIGK